MQARSFNAPYATGGHVRDTLRFIGENEGNIGVMALEMRAWKIAGAEGREN